MPTAYEGLSFNKFPTSAISPFPKFIFNGLCKRVDRLSNTIQLWRANRFCDKKSKKSDRFPDPFPKNGIMGSNS